MGLLENLYSDLIAESVLAVGIGILGYYFKKHIKKQKKRDEEQDRINQERDKAQHKRDEEQDKKLREWRADFENELRKITIRTDYFEMQRLTAYQKIRQFAQQARDEARKIENAILIENHNTWIQKLFENYAMVLDLLHEYALLLEHFGLYNYFHEFKNGLLNFCLTAQKLNSKRENDRYTLMTEFVKFSRTYDKLIANIKFPSNSMIQESEEPILVN